MSNNGLILQHQKFHNTPAYQISYSTEWKYDEITCFFSFESKKFHALLNIIEKGAIFLVKEKDSYLYKIRALNNKAVVHLNLKDKRSIVLGKEMDSLLEKNSSAMFYSIVDEEVILFEEFLFHIFDVLSSMHLPQ